MWVCTFVRSTTETTPLTFHSSPGNISMVPTVRKLDVKFDDKIEVS